MNNYPQNVKDELSKIYKPNKTRGQLYIDDIKDFDDSEIVNMVASQVAKAGNRAERRKILKALNKTKNIEHYTSRKINERADEEVKQRVDMNFGYIMSAVCIVLHDKYHWKNDGEHGQISAFIERVSKELQIMGESGMFAEDAIKKLEEVTGIELVVQ